MREDLADLLDGLEGDARDLRAALIDELLENGCGPDEIRAAHAQGRLELLPLERVFGDEGDRTLEDIAEATGVDPDAIVATRRALGLPAERGRAVYGSLLEEHARRLSVGIEAGIPLGALVDINRVIARAMGAVAAASRDTMLALLEDASVDEATRPLRAAQAAEALAPELEKVLGYAFREHVREMVRQEAGTALTEAEGSEGLRTAGIAFADLVGFTRLGEEIDPRGLSDVAQRLERLASEQARPGVAVVKTIGDEVMLASQELPALVESVLALLTAADAEGDGFPRLRAGAAAGPVVRRAGDWYGRTVNLAARLTSLADPGTLAANAALREAASAAARWSELGPRSIRGIGERVVVHAAVPRPSSATD